MTIYSKYKRILLAVLIINIFLVSTHEGEFWPFSIFPMFSKAGQPWTRALVQEIDKADEDVWENKNLDEIRANVISLDQYGIDQIDYSNFISKTTDWNARRTQALADMLEVKENINSNKYWVATKVQGYLTDTDSVVVNAVPLFLISPDTLIKNPKLFN